MIGPHGAPGRGAAPARYADQPRRFEVFADIPLSRRLMRHVVQDPEGSVVYEARGLGDVLIFLREREVMEFALHAWDASYIVRMERIPQPEG